MLLHSEAKVEFYRRYLERYLRILALSQTIEEINIYDVFCGTGVYDDGKKGSPLVALDVINRIGDEKPLATSIYLHVNDSNRKKYLSVSDHLVTNNKGYCSIDCQNQSAEEMFDEIKAQIGKQGRKVRNLLFIDPYGYKEIKKDMLSELLSNGRTEIILFLPIAQMQRFTSHALSSNDKEYQPLKNFVQSFFADDHVIRSETISPLDYIQYLKDALKFGGKHYSTSYYIERDAANYYALFFMTSHLYGFDRILEVKWALDEDDGRGFRQTELVPSMPLLAALAKEEIRNEHFDRLEKILEASLRAGPKDNGAIYAIILQNEFRHAHGTEVFKRWQETRPEFKVLDFNTKEPVSKGRFYINWDNCRKPYTPKVEFRLE